MALIKCKECGKSISDTIDNCPHCGFPLNEIEEKEKEQSNPSSIYVWLLAFSESIALIVCWIIWYIMNSFIIGAIFGVATLVGIGILFLKQDYKWLHQNNIDTDYLGKFSAFKMNFPKYLYKRSFPCFCIWTVSWVILVFAVLFEYNPLYSFNSSINFVKQGTLYTCPNYTVEELVNNYIEHPKWKSSTKDGIQLVSVTGEVSYKNKPVKVKIEYYIDDKEFFFNRMEKDGVTQTISTYSDLVMDMCRNAQTISQTKKSSSASKVSKTAKFSLNDVEYNDNKINVYLFYGEGCPHCESEMAYFKSIENEYGEYFILHKYEVWNNQNNRKIMNQIASQMGDTVSGVPYTIIGTQSFVGFSDSIGNDMLEVILSQCKNSYDIVFE